MGERPLSEEDDCCRADKGISVVCIEQDDATNDEHNHRKQPCAKRCLNHVCCKCFLRLHKTWPRTTSLCLGVILPLWSIALVSMLLGALLAHLEAPGEYDANDSWMAVRSRSTGTINAFINTSTILPEICAGIYFDSNKTLDDLEKGLEEIFEVPALRGLDESSYTTMDPSSSVVVNTTDMLEYMEECGELFGNFTKEFVSRSLSQLSEDTSVGLSFSWTRCVGDSNRCFLGSTICGLLGRNYSAYLPEAQKAVYATAWSEDQSALFQSYFQEYVDAGVWLIPGARLAHSKSLQDATGRGNCTVNTPAGAWFWFTVMSTIGYGNQAPSTSGGRTMIYVLGFASIVAFGGIIARSGYVVTAVFDDIVRRFRNANKLATPFFGSILWGILYYAWMTVIAGYTKKWKEDRLGEDFPFGDAFWFAFISTTTVGLGDFYLEPEVLQTGDLLYFPLLFLFGFVLLSNFVVKFSQLVNALVPQNVNDPLEERLANTNVISCFPVKKHDENDDVQDSSRSDSADSHDLDLESNMKGSSDTEEISSPGASEGVVQWQSCGPSETKQDDALWS